MVSVQEGFVFHLEISLRKVVFLREIIIFYMLLRECFVGGMLSRVVQYMGDFVLGAL